MDEMTQQDKREQEIAAKKRKIGVAINLLLALLVLITVGSCASRMAYRVAMPMETVVGETWNSDWTLIGKRLGVDPLLLPEGWTLDYNSTISTVDKVYMALYGCGTPETVTYLDNDNKEAQRNRYMAGCYIMTRGAGSDTQAQADLAEWQEVQSKGCAAWTELETFSAGAEEKQNSYRCYGYRYEDGQSEDYTQGLIAYSTADGWATSVQLDWDDRAGWDQQEGIQQLKSLLNAIHQAL